MATEINRLNENGEINSLFLDVIDDGEKTGHSPLLECSGKYEGSIQYEGKVYENWINWGYDCLFLLDANDLENTHQDREGRVGETLKVDQCRTDRGLILNTIPAIIPVDQRKHSDGWGAMSTC